MILALNNSIKLITDNMDEIDDIGIEEGFQVAQGRKRRRVTSSSSSSVAEVSKETQKKVFIKTETGKLNPIRVQRQVGELLGRSDVKIISRNNLLIVIAKNDDETVKLSQIKNLDGVAANAHVAAKPKYCIIGVPANVDDDSIKLSTGCGNATRIFKNIGGSKVASSVVILSFQGNIPDKVKIGYLSFKVKPYIREPTRCYKCNAYGHIALNCTNKAKCPRCLGEHSLKECPNKEAEMRCASCNSTSHHTGQAVCPQRKIEKEAILLKTTKHISYAKALTAAKNKAECVLATPSDPSPGDLPSTSSKTCTSTKTSSTQNNKQNKQKQKKKQNKKPKAGKSQEHRENPATAQLNVSAVFIARLITKISQQMNRRFHGGNEEQFQDVLSHVCLIAFECMSEELTPEEVRTATKTSLASQTSHHE